MMSRIYAALVGLLALLLLPSCSGAEDGPTESPAEDPETRADFVIPAEPGLHERLFDHDGQTRRYAINIPASYDGLTATPLVYFFHGGGATLQNSLGRMDIRGEVERAGWLHVMPEGYSRKGLEDDSYVWNAVHCCDPALRDDSDDVGFIRSLTQELRSALNVDETRIYAMGFSNGAMFTHRLASEASDVFVAVVVSTGTIGGQAGATSPEVRISPPPIPVSVMMYHGRQDPRVRIGGGLSGSGTGRIDLPLEEAARFWAEANHCHPNGVEQDEPFGTVVSFNGCEGSAEVIVLVLDDLDHSWPFEGNSGIRGAVVAVDFLERHSR